MDYAKFRSMLEEAVLSTIDSIAVEGLTALKRILDESGFADSPNLKDYEVTASVSKDSVEFELLIDFEGLDEDSKRKMRKENEEVFDRHANEVKGRSEARDFVKTYTMSPRTKRPERIVGMRDARRPPREGRRFQRDARKIPYDRHRTDASKTSGQRYVEHEFAATAPRGLDVDDSGKLRIALHREIRNTKKGVIFPKGDYQGIVKKFVEQIEQIMEEKFVPELESIIMQHIS